MNRNKHKISLKFIFSTIINIFFFLTLGLGFASAEYNSEKLGYAMGGYIKTTDLMVKLENSKCRYIFKQKHSLQVAIDESLLYLNDSDKDSLAKYMESDDFVASLNQNDGFIAGFIDNGINEGLDEKTLCGMLAQNVSFIYAEALEKWEEAKILYSE